MPDESLTDSLLQQRIRERLLSLRRTPRDVSIKAGLGAEALRAILTGRSRSPRADTLAAIAKELQCDVSYLLGESDSAWPDPDLVEHEGQMRGVTTLLLTQKLYWDWALVADDADPKQDPHVIWPLATTDISSLIEYRPAYQQAQIVTDDHASRFFVAGTILHVLEFEPGREIQLRDRDLVIVSLTQKVEGGTRIQRTVRQVRIFGGDTLLDTVSLNPQIDEDIPLHHKPIADSKGIVRAETGTKINLEGLVLRAVERFSGPEIVKGQIEDA